MIANSSAKIFHGPANSTAFEYGESFWSPPRTGNNKFESFVQQRFKLCRVLGNRNAGSTPALQVGGRRRVVEIGSIIVRKHITYDRSNSKRSITYPSAHAPRKLENSGSSFQRHRSLNRPTLAMRSGVASADTAP